ncbi:hypothetical protein SO694_00092082 [Aureococcus anophagefferens]|uniref:GYF domain-containing protein n=1 Tax=Aureococcus anophagefferens TaxID=44056 RepID=A0ABR1FRV4_AURAN
MGAKYGETRLVSPTAEVVCLGLAAVLGGVALVPGVRWATTQSRFRCDLGHLRDTVDYAYAASFFEHDVRRIRSGGFDGWRPWNGDPCGRSAVLVESGGPGAATRRDAKACLRAEGPFLFSDSEFDEASPPRATFHAARSASVAGAGLAVVGLWLLMLGALSADRSPKKAVLSGSVALACGAGSFAQAASGVLFLLGAARRPRRDQGRPGPVPQRRRGDALLPRRRVAGVGLARTAAPPARRPDGDVELAARPARRPPSPAALADVEIAQRSPLAALRRAPSSDEDDDEVKSESSSSLGEERPLGELIFHYIDARYRRSSHRRLEDVEAAWCAGLLDAGSLVCGEGLADDWTPVQDVERLRAHLQLLEWKPKTSPVRNRQSLPKDAKFDAGDLADLADDDDDERPARRHSGGTIKLHRRTPSG